MADENVTRRQFIQQGAAVAAGVAAGLTPAGALLAGNPRKRTPARSSNYNPDMEYRRCGKTGLMVLAVCMGGHWKRIGLVVPQAKQAEGWSSVGLGIREFQDNRRDVVTRCIECGIQLH